MTAFATLKSPGNGSANSPSPQELLTLTSEPSFFATTERAKTYRRPLATRSKFVETVTTCWPQREASSTPNSESRLMILCSALCSTNSFALASA